MPAIGAAVRCPISSCGSRIPEPEGVDPDYRKGAVLKERNCHAERVKHKHNNEETLRFAQSDKDFLDSPCFWVSFN